MNEREEFLTKEDFARFDPEISQIEIDRINNHPKSNDEIVKNVFTRCNFNESLGFNQLGYQIKTGGDLVVRDFTVIGYERNGKPKYKEEMDRVDKIWNVYQDIKTKMRSSGDERHIFLIKKGKRIEGVGENRHSGWLTSDVLAIKKDGSNNTLNLIFSFNDRGSGVFKISYRKNGETRFASLDKKTDVLDYKAGIDLTKLKSTKELREKINKSTKKR